MGKKPLLIRGHHGLGDNLHQRAIVRQLMSTHDVWLRSSWVAPYHDLVERGLKVVHASTILRTQTKNAEREKNRFSSIKPPADAQVVKLSYMPKQVRAAGSVLGAMFLGAGLKPASLDFRLPVPTEWKQGARELIGPVSRPIMVFRPLVVRSEWHNDARNPDYDAYADLFRSIRSRYHVVSIADLKPNEEWMVGQDVGADQEFHHGELDFETMAGLFSIADLVFCSPGFAVVLAQAVSTPAIVIFGGYERAYSFSAGARYSPWCPIEPVQPVDDFNHRARLSKAIDVSRALGKIHDFLATKAAA